MASSNISRCLIFTTLALGAGCIADDDPVDVTAQAKPGDGDDCPVSECGSNGARLNRFFHELDETGVPNLQGMRVIGFSVDGVEYGLEVVGTEIRGKSPAGTLLGTAVEQGLIKVDDNSGAVWTIRIAAVLQTGLYPNDGTQIYAYEFQVTNPSGADARNLCATPEAVSGDFRDTLGLGRFNAVVFKGDRYVEATLEIIPAKPDQTIFSIGCAGTLVSKMVLTHHTNVTSTATYPTAMRDRRALFNALSANVCGDGTSFTVNGRKVGWTNGTFLPNLGPANQLQLDGRYDEHGATCMSRPRLEGTTNQDAIDTWGVNVGTEIGNIIRDHCERVGHRLPRCGDVEDVNVHATWGHPVAISGVF